MELIQLSTPWCSACNIAKEFIEKHDNINYVYIDLTKIENVDTKYLRLIEPLNVSSVPHFLCVEDDSIILDFKGFDKKTITNCINYMQAENLESTSIKVDDVVPQEISEAMDLIKLEDLFKDDD